MADLDAELGHRLARLAESVPVAPWLGHVEPSPVAARRQVRMAWLTALVALAVVAGGMVVLDRPNEPGATEPPVGVVSRVSQGPFVLELRSTKARYAPDEPIEMTASLTYVGDQPSVRISHALGPMQGPIGFGTVEPVVAHHRLGTVWETACSGTELRRGEPLTIPFAKGGFVMNADEPGADEFMRYLQDPVLRLPAGTWHPHAVAEFALGGCGGDTVTIRAQIEIQVEAAFEGVVAVRRDGDFELTIRSPKATWLTGEPIEIEAILRYTGSEAAVQISHGLGANGGPMAFGIEEPIPIGGGIDLQAAYTTVFACVGGQPCPTQPICEQSELQRGGGRSDGFRKPAMAIGRESGLPGEVDRDERLAFLGDPDLRLPAGTWHPYVIAEFGEGTANPCASRRLRVELEITVVDPPANSATTAPGGHVQLRTAQAPNGSRDCPTALGGGTLAPNPRTGLGFEDDGQVTDVIWPFGWTAAREGEVISLVDERGEVVARTGEQRVFGGANVAKGVFAVCVP